MMKTLTGRWFAFAIASLAAVVSHAATTPVSGKSVAHPKSELAIAADTAVQRGFHAQLPPHISTLLGLTHEETCAVLQAVLRSSDRTQGFEVTEKNHNDIVIFVVDENTKDQIFYLTSPSGTLRKVLAVKQGVGNVVKPTPDDAAAFEKEKEMWKERLTQLTPAK